MYLNESYSRVRIGRLVSNAYSVQNAPVQEDPLSPLECAVRKTQENQDRLSLNGSHLLLVYSDALHILGEDITLT